MIGIDFLDKLAGEVGIPLVKEGIKFVTGIDLDAKELTPEDKQKILDNEFKIKSLDFDKLRLETESKLEEKRIALEKDKAFLGDKQRASNREIETTKTTGKRDYPLYILAGIIVTAFFISLIYLLQTHIDKNSGVYELLLILFGALTAKFSTVIDYFFGASNS